MGLQQYNLKRNFSDTPEPRGKVAHSKSKLAFVVQRHKASHLHYDLRLEIDGVMKSWAVPKGPSMNPGDKRLAMMVEDHPISYNTFSGIIPEGNYGAGIVEIWDEGSYSDVDNSGKDEAEKKLRAGLKAGNLKFTLYGKKLKGEFALVRLRKAGENQWLLIKHRDKFATDEEYNSEKETPKNSPINKWLRTVGSRQSGSKQSDANKRASRNSKLSEKIKSAPAIKKAPVETEIPAEKRRKVRALPSETRKLSKYIAPMLAKESDQPFSDPEWIYEMKWDGYRAIAEVNKSKVSLYSRNGNTFDSSYPVVVDALKEMGINAVLDGEIIVVDENGKSDFQRLQYYGTDNQHPMEYRVFDVLFINGKDVTQLPLLERKEKLRKLLKQNEVVKYSDHISEKGEAFFKAAQEQNLEGIMAKKADSQYHIGKRSSEWLKIKNVQTEDVLIAGFTEPTGSRQHFGALILALRDGDKLKYIGHTGTGFDTKGLNDLYKKMLPLVTTKSPFEEKIKTNMPATWIKPVLVAEVKFTERTREGSLRHPVFLRLRDDKKAKEATMEAAQRVDVKAKTKSVSPKAKKTKSEKEAEEDSSKEKDLAFGKTKVHVTNLQKVFWPDEGFTKGDVINYYISVSKYILPFLKGRPQSLKRNPNGITDTGFYHKDAGQEAPSFVKSVPVHSDSGNKDIDYILCNDQPTLTYLNNLGCIEINPWHSSVPKLEMPDYVVIDLDPSDGNTFDEVIEAANVIRDILKRGGAEGYCKTSGATGLHIYIPTGKKYTYDQIKDFANIVCILAQEELPDTTTLVRNLKKRGSKMIYLDHLQNRRGQTISSVYSLRPKPGAPVSMPLKWTEVKPGLTPTDFNIQNALKRIEKNPEAFKEVLGKGIDLLKVLKKLGA
jgi:bifunctional non-homologous end joining protein LigD